MARRPASDHDMVYDSQRNCIVLFGGHGPGGSLGDTWEDEPTNTVSPWPPIATQAGLAGLPLSAQGFALDPGGACWQVSQPLYVIVQQN